MTEEQDPLTDHRILIDACLRHRVPFWWQGPGTFLIEAAGIGAVLDDVRAQGHAVLGAEVFELESTVIHPNLGLMFGSDRRPDIKYSNAFLEELPPGVWIDVTLRVE